jgi:hypothetical protein
MERIDKDGNSMEVRYQSNNKGQEWYKLFDTHKDLLAEVKQLREQFRLAYEWVDYQFPDGGTADFTRYIGDEETASTNKGTTTDEREVKE